MTSDRWFKRSNEQMKAPEPISFVAKEAGVSFSIRSLIVRGMCVLRVRALRVTQ